ncbi:hypothetical protein [Bacillus thuringiensis]|uniref:hypothetical protein n=1 Tax=Bacillus thuringiensis TaxID=1428 RepID=UPI000BFD7213|nr:hypothetical protein [Bacillus thuringiensis]PGT89816.1 hypothetical protein COD17_08695 [Bacillus thuringiensis]
MAVIHIEKQKEDGTKLDIRICHSDDMFWIDDIGVKTKGKRKFTYVCNDFRNDYTYRGLDHAGQNQMKLEKLLEVCGVVMMKEALEEAWMKLKPTKIKVSYR